MTLRTISRRALLAVGGSGLAALTMLALPTQAQPKLRQPPVFTGLVKGVAVGGYDPVAYFTEGKPVEGRADITHEHQGAVWRFASEANRQAFQAEPARFAPQYGGYCAIAVASGYTAKGDPEAWSIASGKLYLNYNKAVRKLWEQDIPGNIRKGDANWPAVLER